MKICKNVDCKKSGKRQSSDNFSPVAASVDGRASWCKKCLVLKRKKGKALSKEPKITPFFANKKTIEAAIANEEEKIIYAQGHVTQIKSLRQLKGGTCVVYAQEFVNDCENALSKLKAL